MSRGQVGVDRSCRGTGAGDGSLPCKRRISVNSRRWWTLGLQVLIDTIHNDLNESIIVINLFLNVMIVSFNTLSLGMIGIMIS
jgi:hypothetical protein